MAAVDPDAVAEALTEADPDRVLIRYVVVSEWADVDGTRSLSVECGDADGQPLEAWERDMLLRAQDYIP